MAKCPDCGQEMSGEHPADTCTYDTIRAYGRDWPRSREHFGELDGRCGDCNIKHGGIHHLGCCRELCPRCGLQLIGCDCWPKKFQLVKKGK